MSTQTAPGRARRRWLLVALAGLAAVLVVVAVFLATRPAPEPEPVPTVVGPAPTPVLDPVERDTGTPLTSALPDAVLSFAVVAQEEEERPAGVVEAHRLTYSDGAREVHLRVTQWRDAERAEEMLAGLVAENGIEATREGDVVVEGATAGRHVIGDGHALWTNGTTVFHLRGPDGVVGGLYDAFGL